MKRQVFVFYCFLLLTVPHSAAYAAETAEKPAAEAETEAAEETSEAPAPPEYNTELSGELVYRASLGSVEDVKLLLSQGADPNARDEGGKPALALASIRTDAQALEVLQALVQAGADVNLPDAEGQTPVFHAARRANLETIRWLEERGANLYHADYHGDIARNLAHRAGHKETVTYLDGLMLAKSRKVQAQYEEYMKAVEAHNAYVEALEAEQKKAEQLAEEERELLKEKQRLAKLEQQRLAQELNAQILAKRTPERLNELVRDLSFASCAMQYWSFCQEKKYKAAWVSEEKYAPEIVRYQEQAYEAATAIAQEYSLGQTFVDSVTNPSKQRIHDQLHQLSSNSNRRDEGVGKEEDLKKRCEKIASGWSTEPESSEKKERKERTGKPPRQSYGSARFRYSTTRPSESSR